MCLKAWSGGVISGATRFDVAAGDASYVVDEMPDVTRQLTDVHFPMTAKTGTSLAVANGGHVILQASVARRQAFQLFAPVER